MLNTLLENPVLAQSKAACLTHAVHFLSKAECCVRA